MNFTLGIFLDNRSSSTTMFILIQTHGTALATCEIWLRMVLSSKKKCHVHTRIVPSIYLGELTTLCTVIFFFFLMIRLVIQ